MPIGDGIRRNIATVSQAERNRLRDAILALNQRLFPGSKNDPIPGGVSYWFKQDEIHDSTHVHFCPAFLPWHRELMNRFEAMLREIDPMLSLHYWNWTQDPQHLPDGEGGFINLFTPDFMGNAIGPGSSEIEIGDPWRTAGFYGGPGPFRDNTGNPAHPPQTVTRQVGVNASLVNPTDEQTLLSSPDFVAFDNQMEGFGVNLHGQGHGYIGGDLLNPHTSFRDPFVFQMHCNIDRLFAMWQRDQMHPERLDPAQLYKAQSTNQNGFENTKGGDRTTIDPPGVPQPGDNDVNSLAPWWGILSSLEPWAGPGNTAQTAATGIIQNVKSVRPWAPPENQQIVKDAKHPTVVAPADYDTFTQVHLPTKNSSFMTQGRFGSRGNFEMVVPRSSGGLAHFWRANDDPSLPWNGPRPFGSSDTYAAIALIQSNFTSSGHGAGNLEVVARTGNGLDFYWREDAAPFTWHDGAIAFESGVSGNPALIQGNFGVMGNFEMVVPLATGGLAHFWRVNDDPSLPCNGPIPFGSSDAYDAVALIQSNFSRPGNSHGNLELVARSGNRLDFYWREDAAPFTWHGPFIIETI